MILVVSLAPAGTTAQQDNVIYDWEDGNDNGWSSDSTFSVDNDTSRAYAGDYSYRFEGTGSLDTADYSLPSSINPQSVSGRIRFQSLPGGSDTSYPEFIVRGGGGGAWGTFQIRGDGSLYRAVDGDQNSYTDTGIDLETGRYYTLTFKNFNYSSSTVTYAIDGETIATDIQSEFNLAEVASIELVGDDGTYNFDYITKNFANTYRITGKVIDDENDPVENANVTINDSADTTVQTGPSGRYSVRVENGTYGMVASKPGYFNDSATVTVDGKEATQNFRIRNLSRALSINTRGFLRHGESADYTIFFSKEETNRTDVTAEASISSRDTNVVTIDRANQEIVATENTSINNQTYLQATYTGENESYVTRSNVTVANSSMENLAILPTTWRVNATFADSTIQAILVAIFAGVFGARLSSSFGGLALMQLTMVAGWFTGYNDVGITMISLFTALFIGLNMAANVDYTARR
jgi:hypothetical protein